MDWKNNVRVQIAVGVAVIVLAVRWLFAPTLQDAALAYSTPAPAEGQLADPVSGLALIWPAVEIVLAVLAGIGAYVINLGEWLFSKIQTQASPTKQQTVATSPDEIQRDLIQAIATNDQAARARLEPMVRGPEAISELTAAVATGDFETAEAKLAELQRLAAQSEQSEAPKK